MHDSCSPRHPVPAAKHGRSYTNFAEVTADYESGALHPSDLKPALAKAINDILQVGPRHRRRAALVVHARSCMPRRRGLAGCGTTWRSTGRLVLQGSKEWVGVGRRPLKEGHA